MPAVVLPPLARPVDELWHVLLHLGETIKVHWTLIGGQMVLLHALAHGQVSPQISQDGDVIADIRATPSAIKVLIAALEVVGFAIEGRGRTALPITTSGPQAHPARPPGTSQLACLLPTGPARELFSRRRVRGAPSRSQAVPKRSGAPNG